MIEHKELKAKVKFVESPTVLQQLQWRGMTDTSHGNGLYTGHFFAVIPLVEKWECDLLPDLQKVKLSRANGRSGNFVYLDECTDPKITRLIAWLGNQVVIYMNALQTVPEKNS